jgi:F-type H+-transporting ATPase subunit alpha
VVQFEKALHDYFNRNQADWMKEINDSGDYSEQIANRMHEGIRDFKANHSY